MRTRISIALVSLVIIGPALFAQAQDQAKAEGKTDDRLVCIGALASAHIYTTYGYVGTVADAFAKETYTADRVQELMKEVVGLSDVSIKHLKTIREGNIVDTDKKAINDFIEVYGLLKEEAQGLSDYSKSKDNNDLQKFEKARTTVWPKLKAVLGIKDPPADVNK